MDSLGFIDIWQNLGIPGLILVSIWISRVSREGLKTELADVKQRVIRIENRFLGGKGEC